MDAAVPARPTSATAEATALGRAIESLRHGPDRLVHDPFARLFLSRRRRCLLTAMRVPSVAAALLSLHERRLPGVLGNLLCRTRFIDDAILESLTGGIQQVVILGSGFDSRPYRLSGCDHLPIFEVDRGPLLAKKRSLLESSLGGFPSKVAQVALDFQHQHLGEALAASGFNMRLPTFFIWEGVTQYLTAEAIDEVLRFVASTVTGSRIAFSYIEQSVIDGIASGPSDAAVKGWVERLSEPWISGFAPGQIAAFLEARRLSIETHVGAVEYQRRYLQPSGRVLNLYDHEHVVVARVIR